MYTTTHALPHHSRTYTNVCIGIGSTCVFKVNFNKTVIIKSRLAQLVEHQALSPEVVGLTPKVSKTFSFVFCRFRRASDRSTGPIQMKSSMTFIRGI